MTQVIDKAQDLELDPVASALHIDRADLQSLVLDMLKDAPLSLEDEADTLDRAFAFRVSNELSHERLVEVIEFFELVAKFART